VRAVLLSRHDGDDEVWAALFSHRDAASGWARLVAAAAAGGQAMLSTQEASALHACAPWAGAALVHAGASCDFVRSLADAADWRVREAVARHPHTPAATIRRLARDSDFDVRTACARRSDLALTLLSDLAADVHQTVRSAVAEHPRTPSSVIGTLFWDDAEAVRLLAEAHPRRRASFAELRDRVLQHQPIGTDALRHVGESGPYGKRLVAGHPSLDADAVAVFAGDLDWRIRELAAAHPHATAEQLSKLVGDPDRDVRRAVAANAHTPAALLGPLVDDPDDTVREAALAHPALPATHRARVLRRARASLLRSERVLDQMIVAAIHRGTPWELRRARYRCSLSWVVRYAVAANPDTPFEVVQLLTRDLHPDVRDTAIASVATRRRAGAPLVSMREEVLLCAQMTSSSR
jgi:hypothetical protein